MKWDCSARRTSATSDKRNWDYYFGYPGAATDYFWPVITEGSHGQSGPPTVHEGYVEDVVMAKAIEWVKQKREKPFCLIFWFQSPHAPFFRPRRLLDLYNGIPIPKPATFDDDLRDIPANRALSPKRTIASEHMSAASQTNSNCARTLEEVVKDYYAGIVAADENAGKLFQALTDMGQLDDTAIMFSSDHGFFLGEWRKYDKRFMHEPSIRTPMLIRYPRMARPGSTVDADGHQPRYCADIPRIGGDPGPGRMQGLEYGPVPQGREARELAQGLAIRVLRIPRAARCP